MRRPRRAVVRCQGPPWKSPRGQRFDPPTVGLFHDPRFRPGEELPGRSGRTTRLPKYVSRGDLQEAAGFLNRWPQVRFLPGALRISCKFRPQTNTAGAIRFELWAKCGRADEPMRAHCKWPREQRFQAPEALAACGRASRERASDERARSASSCVLPGSAKPVCTWRRSARPTFRARANRPQTRASSPRSATEPSSEAACTRLL
jgi:hypothetical protein